MLVTRLELGELATNCYVITDEATGATAVIDPAEYDEQLEKVLCSSKIKSVDYILLTHGHFDHIGGADAIKNRYNNCKLAVGEQDGKMLTSALKNGAYAFLGYEIKCSSAVDILLKDGDEIMLGESKIKVMHTPGHTMGGVCYITDEFIFSGDTLFYMGCGRCDIGGNTADMLSSLKRIVSIPGDLTVYTGHGSKTNLKREREQNPYINRGI